MPVGAVARGLFKVHQSIHTVLYVHTDAKYDLRTYCDITPADTELQVTVSLDIHVKKCNLTDWCVEAFNCEGVILVIILDDESGCRKWEKDAV